MTEDSIIVIESDDPQTEIIEIYEGSIGPKGDEGKSAFEVAVDNGFIGTEQEWLDSLKGEKGEDGSQGADGADGKSAYQVAVDNGFIGTESDWLASLQGEQGEDGKSAYEVAVEEGFIGTEEQWLDSLVGPQGPQGPSGGIDGKSAYEIAVDNGFVGTEEEWLDSLIGPAGAAGSDGADGKSAYQIALDEGFIGTEQEWLDSLVGPAGADGQDGTDGTNGVDGDDGKSAYQIAVDEGFVGDEVAWLASLKGDKGDQGDAGSDGANGVDGADGKSAYQVAVDNGFIGTEGEWLDSLIGPAGSDGSDGTNGSDGADGKSAYEIAVDEGFIGDETAWLASLKGDKGDKGDVGDEGPAGADGTNGSDGADGESAYEIAVDNGFVGTEEQWLESLVGPQGEKGDKGDKGDDGDPASNIITSVNGLTGVVVLNPDHLDDTTSAHKFASAGELSKLAGIAAGATANDSDANLKNRANHTGTQTASTISDFNSSVDGRITTQKGAVNGIASLDSNGLVPTNQLPSFVDDVLEFDDLADFPTVGETGKIYVAIDTGKTYRWSGTVYTELNPSDVISVNGQSGAVVLDADNISDDSTTHKFVTAGDITKLGNLSGVNSGDQTITLTGAVTGSGTGSFATTFRNSTALSVMGRSANSSGTPADIAAATDGHVLRRSGTTLGFGTIATAGIADSAVTYAKMQNIAAGIILGRSTTGTGNVEGLDATAVKTLLSLTIGTDVQAQNARLQDIAGNLSATSGAVEKTGANTFGTFTVTAYAKTILDDSTAAAARTTLGLGTASVVNTGTGSGDVPLNSSLGALAYLASVGTSQIANNAVTVAKIADVDIRAIKSVDIITANAARTFPLTDNGGAVYKTNTTAYSWTVPANATVAHPVGTVITVCNLGTAGDVTIVQASGVTLTKLGDGSTGNRVLKPYGKATLHKNATNGWDIIGIGLE